MIILMIDHNASSKISVGKFITTITSTGKNDLGIRAVPLVDILINLQLKTSAPRLAAPYVASTSLALISSQSHRRYIRRTDINNDTFEPPKRLVFALSFTNTSNITLRLR